MPRYLYLLALTMSTPLALVAQILTITPDQPNINMMMPGPCEFKSEAFNEYTSGSPNYSISLTFYAETICPSGINEEGYLHLHSSLQFVSEMAPVIDENGQQVNVAAVSPLQIGESVTPTSTYLPGVTNQTGHVLYTDGLVTAPPSEYMAPQYSGGYHAWQYAQNRYVGFRLFLTSSQEYLYGWIQLNVSGDGGFGFQVSVTEIALNTTPGASIQIGQTEGIDEDFNGDGLVDINDFLIINSEWGACPGCVSDLTGNGIVDVEDFVIFNSAFDQ